MPTVVVFDCESDSRPSCTGFRGEQDFAFVQCTCACALILDAVAFDLEAAKELTCWRDVAPHKGANPFKALLEAFDDADIIVGYNQLEFDMPLLRKHYGTAGQARYAEHRFKCVDIFSRVRAATNQWPKLQDLLLANDLGGKCGSGAGAIKLWEKGLRTELEAYCKMDVRRTAQLALLPRMRFGDMWIPSHVYGIVPAVQATMTGKSLMGMLPTLPDTPAPRSAPPTPTRANDDDEEVFVFVDAQ